MATPQQPTLFDMAPDPWLVDDDLDIVIARVVFAQGADGVFDYRVPDVLRESVEAGKRLRVPLGRGNRGVIAYCVEVTNRREHRGKLKDVESVLDSAPIAAPGTLTLTRWMADYYLVSWGRVLEGVVPAGVRRKAGTRMTKLFSVATNPKSPWTAAQITEKQSLVMQAAQESGPMPLTQLCQAAGCTAAPVQALVRKGLLAVTEQRIQSEWDRQPAAADDESHELNESQQAALAAITAGFTSAHQAVFLLHGVTGSGKTEVYMRAIQQAVAAGRQAIVLVPEISLTPQTCRRFRARFRKIAVLHSHLSDAERHWHWQQIASGAVQVVVGARSAIFAPTPQLGLIVIDEEHDASFKQDSVPRYHARDVALKRSEIEGIPVVLGSATPALDSWHHAQQGEYKLISMATRIRNRPLPPVDIVDLRTMTFDKSRRGSISRPLEQQIRRTLADQGQVILLLNRRGFSTHIQCPACGKTLQCPECDIALTHHREFERALCHYCDFQRPAPPQCPECQFEGIRYSGAGTQKLEAEVRGRFPGVTCLRMDSDSMKRPGSHEEAFQRFRDGQVSILLGTQMIAKGLDFPNVTLVGVLNADTALHLPDFRAAERTFQLITQVAGRTGRSERGGRVIVQSYQPDHPAIVAAARHDYLKFAALELPQRKPLGYPPHGSMVRVIVRGPVEKETLAFADLWINEVRTRVASAAASIRVLGPVPAPFARLRGYYRFHALLQSSCGDVLRQITRESLLAMQTPADIQWVIDVDPLDMM